MTTAENSDDRLWNTSVLSSKSWVEIMEEEERELEAANNSVNLRPRDIKRSPSPQLICNGGNVKSEVKTEPIDDEAQDSSFTTASNKIPLVDDLPTFGKVLNSSTYPKTPVKKEPTEVFQEDLSLTGHLDGFKLISPCKVVLKTENKTSNKTKFSTPEKVLPNRSCKTGEKLIGSGKRKLTGIKTDDSALMPSPSKISRTSKGNTTLTSPCESSRKRNRDNLTPTPKRSPSKKKRELETDPEILTRRQKQIDYGKNTVGYERYKQLVPRESRKKMYPRTPPLNLKFSRRAWDGLVKVWRQRLHFWDPPSEGGGNPECLEVQSEISDCSSTDGSLPSTPVQDWKRQKSSLTGWSPCLSPKMKTSNQHSKRKLTTLSHTTEDCGEKSIGNSKQEETADQFLSQGCTPLPE